MGDKKKIISLVRYEDIGGKKVPIYKNYWVSKEDYAKATEEALVRLQEENKGSLDGKELVDVLKKHAEDTVKNSK